MLLVGMKASLFHPAAIANSGIRPSAAVVVEVSTADMAAGCGMSTTWRSGQLRRSAYDLPQGEVEITAARYRRSGPVRFSRMPRS